MSTLQFTPFGGVGEVGANSYLIEIEGLRLVLDCGLHPKKEGRPALPDFRSLREAPHACIISHAHVDHCGSLPYLCKLHPTTVPYATMPTIKIMDRMLHNSVSVMTLLRNERGILDYPLYGHNDVDFALRKAYGIAFDREFAVHPDKPITVSFTRAGHVLGSASIMVKSPGHTVFYTADICTVDQELMPKFVMPHDVDQIDTLIIESTYGANEEADQYDYRREIKRLGAAAATVLKRGGCVLIPAFALGRCQELLNIVARLMECGVIPEVPIYASGLGRAVYEIYDRFADELRQPSEFLPLSMFDGVGDVWNPEVTRRLLREPCIIVATSGMMIENTPSAVIAQQLVREDRHGIFFVGYCDPDTLGHHVKHAKKGDQLQFMTGAGPTEIKLENIQNFHFSAHAPRRALQWVAETIGAKNIIFVHGDLPAVEWMRDHCANGSAKFTPAIGETVSLKS